ncbi:hypothetical protein KFE98_19750 [bacterium SCSIO 12741]|nr:hypothetical protein KFE98_19750 [bacterium SCSIO 12741]
MKYVAIVAMLVLTFCSCRKGCTDVNADNYNSDAWKDDGSCEYPKGCTDSKAVNYDYEAHENDGSCEYSNVVFYAQYGYFSGVPVTRIEVNVEGNIVGAISATYPNGPGNCSAVGTVNYKFNDGESVDWSAIVYLANGASLVQNGVVSPNRNECIVVNVTR